MTTPTLSPSELSIAAAALRDRHTTLIEAAGACSRRGDQDGRSMALSQAKSVETLRQKIESGLAR